MGAFESVFLWVFYRFSVFMSSPLHSPPPPPPFLIEFVACFFFSEFSQPLLHFKGLPKAPFLDLTMTPEKQMLYLEAAFFFLSHSSPVLCRSPRREIEFSCLLPPWSFFFFQFRGFLKASHLNFGLAFADFAGTVIGPWALPFFPPFPVLGSFIPSLLESKQHRFAPNKYFGPLHFLPLALVKRVLSPLLPPPHPLPSLRAAMSLRCVLAAKKKGVGFFLLGRSLHLPKLGMP